MASFGPAALRHAEIVGGIAAVLLIALGVAGAVSPQIALVAALALCGAMSLASHGKAGSA